METLPRGPSTKGPTEWFTGDVYFDVYYRGEEPSRARLNLVRFAPGARTAWHSHAVGQTLHVTEGAGYVQARGGEVVGIRPGDTIHTPPGQEHWHGATASNFMSHLALWEGVAPGSDEPETTWGALVTDDEYPGSSRDA
ncbi:(R)-mandelonitrile lyase [Mycetocola miduiensis]|uniref:Cupin domain protein n=1 Tax=Mycetocola miduiensis TaxID=995034 RepID=A0A1I5DI57_9MICO|nr:cupin domain-containing protein [Mycetocola miduiensis]SFN98912.1 Cupin domain protein [Mycetocola miduiensis]